MRCQCACTLRHQDRRASPFGGSSRVRRESDARERPRRDRASEELLCCRHASAQEAASTCAVRGHVGWPPRAVVDCGSASARLALMPDRGSQIWYSDRPSVRTVGTTGGFPLPVLEVEFTARGPPSPLGDRRPRRAATSSSARRFRGFSGSCAAFAAAGSCRETDRGGKG